MGEAAWGIHLVATLNMENALRVVSVERGRDPRRYAMVAPGEEADRYWIVNVSAAGLASSVFDYAGAIIDAESGELIRTFFRNDSPLRAPRVP